MKKEHIAYARRLNTIGELIIEISNLMKDLDEVKGMSPEGIKRYKKDLDETIEKFEYAKESIADLTVPSLIQSQHQDLLESFGDFVQSVKILNGSIKINNDDTIGFNANEYLTGLSLQRRSVDGIGQASTAIGDEFLKDEVDDLNSEDTDSNK